MCPSLESLERKTLAPRFRGDDIIGSLAADGVAALNEIGPRPPPGRRTERYASAIGLLNSIFTPASSITSLSFRGCADEPRLAPLTVGNISPSTCAMK